MTASESGTDVARHIAFDFGAESARAVVGTFAEGSFSLEELHRWPSRSQEIQGTRYWDFLFMLTELKRALGLYAAKYGPELEGMGVDSWGVDFGILGESGQLLQNPVQYRDHRTDGVCDQAFGIMPREQIYQETGIQFMQINTLYQLIALKRTAPEVLREARAFLMMSDLAHYCLSGVKGCEYTNASTTQLLDVRSRQWSEKLFDTFDLPYAMMPEIIEPGTVLGPLDDAIAKEAGLAATKVIAPCTHDTACAVLAVPGEGEDWAYISCGTWSLIGVELRDPITSELALQYNFTNEGGIGGTIRFLRNCTGLWVFQQCRAAWAQDGAEYEYSELTGMARSAPPFQAVLDIDTPGFLSPDNMLEAIAQHCRDSGQQPPDGVAAICRTVLEGIALRYAVVIRRLEEIIGRKLDRIHMVGGGIQNEFLCQLASDAMGKPVIAGPVEASSMGNLLSQAIATGRIADAKAARRLVVDATAPKVYEPKDNEAWRPILERIA